MSDYTLLRNPAGDAVRAARRLKKLELAMLKIRKLSDYKGQTTFADLAAKRKIINKIACGLTREED